MRLRIISGTLGGRFIKAPKGVATRPTASRVREAWFSALGDRVQDAAVVDLFAGSGALGIEALSRGARHVHFVESHARTLETLRRNLLALSLEDRSTVVRRDVLWFVDRIAEPFDLAFADPPYEAAAGPELVARYHARPFARELWLEHRWLEHRWLEHRAEGESVEADWTRRYGDTRVSAYRAKILAPDSK